MKNKYDAKKVKTNLPGNISFGRIRIDPSTRIQLLPPEAVRIIVWRSVLVVPKPHEPISVVVVDGHSVRAVNR